MADYFNIPLLWPFKMIPLTNNPGIHFDDRWSHEQIKPWQMKAYYFQKWKRTDTTMLQVEGSAAPDNFKVLDDYGIAVKNFVWVEKLAATGYKIWELVFDVSDQPTNKKYFLYQEVTVGATKWKWISEPIWVKDEWPETLLFTFKHKHNKDGIAWTTGLEMKFRVEGWVCPLLEPKRVRADFVNQVRDVETISSTSYRLQKLYIGNTNQDNGVAPWVIDLMGRISGCSSINISGKKYQTDTGSEWEVWKQTTYSLMSAMIDICPAANQAVSQQNVDVPLAADILVTYQIKTRFFGGDQLVPIYDAETE